MMIQKDSELKAQGGATGGSDSSSIEAKEMPPIGSRVRRGPDWRWENQDDNLPGTVVAHKARGDYFTPLCYSHYTFSNNILGIWPVHPRSVRY